MEAILQYVLYLLILVALAIPLGGYIAKVMKGDKVFLSCICRPCERLIYKVLRVDEKEEMTWKKYALSTILFSGIGLVIFFAIEMLQQILPLNPEKLPGLSCHKYELAGIQRRVCAELFYAGYLPDSMEFCISGYRYCRFIRINQRICEKESRHSWKLLGGFDKNRGLHITAS